jgi:hypothetical protein
MQSRSLSFVSAHQARNSSVKALCCESTGAIALIGRSPREARVRKTSHFRGQKFIATTLTGKKIAALFVPKAAASKSVLSTEKSQPNSAREC